MVENANQVRQWWSLAELNAWEPDPKDYASTFDVLKSDEEVDEHALVWTKG